MVASAVGCDYQGKFGFDESRHHRFHRYEPVASVLHRAFISCSFSPWGRRAGIVMEGHPFVKAALFMVASSTSSSVISLRAHR